MVNTAKDKTLAPITEEVDDSMALVAYDPQAKKKMRKDLKMRAKKQVVEELGKNPFKNENTFVTGGGLPGRPKPEEQDEQAEQSGSDENLVDMDEDPED